MIDVRIIPATEEHLQMILPDVRQADIDELYAVSLMTTEDALLVGLRTATMAWSGFANGELVPALIYLQVTRWIYLATLPSLALLIL